MAADKRGRSEIRQTMYVLVAALLCFVGPTYLVALLSEFIPGIFAMTLGFVSFLVGLFLILRLVKD